MSSAPRSVTCAPVSGTRTSPGASANIWTARRGGGAALARVARHRERVEVAAAGQVMAIAPDHAHVARAVQAPELERLGRVALLGRVEPDQAEVVAEVGSLDPVPLRVRAVRRTRRRRPAGRPPAPPARLSRTASPAPARQASPPGWPRARDGASVSSTRSSTGPGAARTQVEWVTSTDDVRTVVPEGLAERALGPRQRHRVAVPGEGRDPFAALRRHDAGWIRQVLEREHGPYLRLRP